VQSTSLSTRELADVGLLLAVAIILQLLTFTLGLVLPTAGSISLSMLPLFIIAYRHGFKLGALSGVLYGLVEMAMYTGFIGALADSAGMFMAITFADYVLAFGIIALGALIFNIDRGSTAHFVAGIVVGGLLRYIVHIVSGVVLFGEFVRADYPETNVVIGSALINGSYMIPIIILTAVIGGLVFARLKDRLAFTE